MIPATHNHNSFETEEHRLLNAATRRELQICSPRSIAYALHRNCFPEEDFYSLFTKILHSVYREEPNKETEQTQGITVYTRRLSAVLSSISAIHYCCLQPVEEHNLRAWFAKHEWKQWLVAVAAVEETDRNSPIRAHAFAVSNSNGTQETKEQSSTMITKVDATKDKDFVETKVALFCTYFGALAFYAIVPCTKECEEDRCHPNWEPPPDQVRAATPPTMSYEEEHPLC